MDMTNSEKLICEYLSNYFCYGKMHSSNSSNNFFNDIIQTKHYLPHQIIIILTYYTVYLCVVILHYDNT